MDLVLSEECPIFLPQHQIDLHRLLDSVVRGWHNLASPDPSRLRILLNGETWGIYGSYITEAFKIATRGYFPITRASNCAGCDPEAVSSFVNLPTALILENATSDGKFLEVMASHLRPRLAHYFSDDSGALQIFQGGGIGELPREVERISRAHRRLRPDGYPARAMVVTDSDAVEPGRVDAAARAVESAAEECLVACHILAKRSIENYIPDEALSTYGWERRHLQPAIAFLRTLSATARDHYPVKEGLPKDAATSQENEDLYPPNAPRGLGLGAKFIVDFLSLCPWSLKRHDIVKRDAAGDLTQLFATLEGNL